MDFKETYIGDAGNQKPHDRRREEKDNTHDGFTLIHFVVREGPFLHCLGALPEGSGRVLEAHARNPRGILTTALLADKENERLRQLMDDMWLRDITCRIQLIHSCVGLKTAKYMTQLLVRSPPEESEDVKQETDNTNMQTREESSTDITNSTDKPKVIYRGFEWPDLDAQVYKGQGTDVRGHAKGLRSKDFLQRVDGVEGYVERSHQDSDGSTPKKCTQIELDLYQCDPRSLPRGPLDREPLTGINADCMDSLMTAIFRQAIAEEKELLDTFEQRQKENLLKADPKLQQPDHSPDQSANSDVTKRTKSSSAKEARLSSKKRMRSIISGLFRSCVRGHKRRAKYQ